MGITTDTVLGVPDAPVEGVSFNTLAQLDHPPLKVPSKTVRQTLQKLQKRARAKYIGFPLIAALCDLESPLEKSYRNSLYCCEILEQREGEITAHYCRNRWCVICNRIRCGQLINRYLPAVEGWRHPHFVTLTRPNVPGPVLRDTVSDMTRCAANCARSLRRKGLGFRAVRKLEITYNGAARSFHPHFHFHVEGQDAARALVSKWLDRNPDAVERAQDVRPADAGSLIELFKYFCKLVDSRRRITPEALDTIFRSIRGKRVFQPVGFRLPPDADNDGEEGFTLNKTTEAVKRTTEAVLWEWMQDIHDWIDTATGDILTGYVPTRQDTAYLEAID